MTDVFFLFFPLYLFVRKMYSFRDDIYNTCDFFLILSIFLLEICDFLELVVFNKNQCRTGCNK